MLLLVISAASVATLLGGLFALYLRDRLHLVLGFSAGAVLSVAFFDLLPEALELTQGKYTPTTVFSMTMIGFVVYLLINRLLKRPIVPICTHHNSDSTVSTIGRIGAGSLSLHSFLDGVAIGLAFQVSISVGIVVAIAVLVHDFSDGINTVGYILKNGGTTKTAISWLAVDAIAPVLGAVSTLFFVLPSQTLGLFLALFSGFFIYIGASDLIPESYHSHPTRWTTVATIVGILVLYIAISLAGSID